MTAGDPCQRARDLLTFADGFDAAGGGNADLARRARNAARDVLELAEQLDAERSARVAIQAAQDRCLGIIGKASYDQVSAAVGARAAS